MGMLWMVTLFIQISDKLEIYSNRDITSVLSQLRQGFGGLNILRTRFSLVGRMHRFPIKFFPALSRHVLPVAHQYIGPACQCNDCLPIQCLVQPSSTSSTTILANSTLPAPSLWQALHDGPLPPLDFMGIG